MTLTSSSALAAVIVFWDCVGLKSCLLLGVTLRVEGLGLDLNLLTIDDRVVVVLLLLRKGRGTVRQSL